MFCMNSSRVPWRLSYCLCTQVEGGLRAEQGDWGTALSLWNKALALTPEDGILHEMRSQALNEVEDAWGAVQAASRAAELLPRSADVLVTLARAQLNLGEVLHDACS